MSPKLPRRYLDEQNFLEIAYYEIQADQFRPHGWHYRLAWIQNGKCRVLFDNHHGKADHYHADDEEFLYTFSDVDQLIADFTSLIRKLGGPI
ncbi:DUF6516 family protein [Bdellovibrionota bacterium FG-1]